MSRVHLLVDSLNEWRASDELGSTLARGTWTVNVKTEVVKVVVDAACCGRTTASTRRERDQFCRAVAAVVHAMRAHG